MAKLVRRQCPCVGRKREEEVRVLDYRHSGLTDLPSDVFNLERTLEELCADSNQIRDLPRELFYCYGLRQLSVSDNEITSIPPAIASLHHLEQLDVSKNGIIDVPDNIKCCKYLRVVDASVNPLGKLPDGFTQLQNLTHLYLNDTFLDYLPGSFGRLVKLKILEMRENHLKTLPKSFGRLTELERIDIGHNEFTELPDVVGCLTKLLELWCDNNHMTSLTHSVGCLKQLMFLDASWNQLTSLPGEIEGCSSLADLHLTSNRLAALPGAIGQMSSLTTLKVDDNQLTSLPSTLGGLTSLSELNVSANVLEELPVSVGLLRNLRTLYADENLLNVLPAEVGSCSGLTVLSVRSNRLTYIPDEIGRIPRLRVLNLSHNRLAYLPFTIVKLKELQALWLAESQTRPLIPLQSDHEAHTGRKILTCYLLPQSHSQHSDVGDDDDDDSFHASTWEEERLQRQQIHFSFEEEEEEEEEEGRLVRCPTPYPKELRATGRHLRNLALRQSLQDSSHTPSRSPQSLHCRHGRHQGRDNQVSSQEASTDGQVGDNRSCKPQPPSLQETHRLYRCDKEKLMRDKARMQHRHSMQEDVTVLRRGDTSGASDTDEGRVVGRRQSTPNLLSFEGQTSSGKLPRRMPSFTYEDLYQKQILRKHHRHEKHSRRMRDYDSDTGYRSDRDVTFRRQGHNDITEDRDCRSDRDVPFRRQRHNDVTEDRDCRSDRDVPFRRQSHNDVTEDRDCRSDREVSFRRQRHNDVTQDRDCRSDREVSFRRQGYKDVTQDRENCIDREVSFRRQSDNDTEPHSDIKDDLSVRSQPSMSRSRRRGLGREGGYTSDIEVYAGRGGRRNRPAPRPRTQPVQHLPYPHCSVPPPLRSQTCSADVSQDDGPGPQDCLTRASGRPNSGSRQGRACPSSPTSRVPSHVKGQAVVGQPSPPLPSHVKGQAVVGQPSPPLPSHVKGLTVTGQPSPPLPSHVKGQTVVGQPSSSSSPLPSHVKGQAAVGQPRVGTWQSAQKPPPSSPTAGGVYVPSVADLQGRSLPTDLSSALEEHNGTTKVQNLRPTSSLPVSERCQSMRQTPPPYQPAPPYRRPSDLVGEPSDRRAVLRSAEDREEVGSGSISAPDSTAVQCSHGKDSGQGVPGPQDTHCQRLISGTSGGLQGCEDRQQQSLALNTDGPQSAMARPLPRTASPQGVGEGTHASKSYDDERSVGTRCDSSSGDQLSHGDSRVLGDDDSVSSSPFDASGRAHYSPHTAHTPGRDSSPQYPAHSPGRGSSPQYPAYTPGRGSSPQYPAHTPRRGSIPQYPSHSPGKGSSPQYPAHTPGRGSSPQYPAHTPRRGPTRQYPAHTVGRESGSQNNDHSCLLSSSRPPAPCPDRCGGGLTLQLPQPCSSDSSSRRFSHPAFTSTHPSSSAPVRPRSGSRDSVFRRQLFSLVPEKPLESCARSSPQPYPGSSPQPYPGSSPQPYPGSSPEPYPSSSPQLYPSSSSQPYASSSPQPYPNSSPQPYPNSSPQPYPNSSSQLYPSSSLKPYESSSAKPCPRSSAQAFDVEPGVCERPFDAYPNPYGEPLEMGEPLMNRYEDVAVFKSLQDPSQVPSSTDSGYGHGQQIYGAVGDLHVRRSGSPYSSIPSHRDTPVRQTSSSLGTPSMDTTPQDMPSRETPPSRKTTLYCLQGSGPAHLSAQESRDVFRTVIHKNPGLGFSIAGGSAGQGHSPFRPGDWGIFVTKVQPDGPAATVIQPGDKLLQVNHIDFINIDHATAVNVLKTSSTVHLLLERVHRINLV